MRDRAPAPGLAGRHKFTPENGDAPFYAIIEVADGGTDGTDLNKANLLTDETANMLGLESTDPVPNEAFQRLAPSIPGAIIWDSGNFIVETGTFTPILGGATSDGSFVLDNHTGYYTRSGKLCKATCYLRTSSITQLPQGAIQIRGFPLFNGMRSSWNPAMAVYPLGLAMPTQGINMSNAGIVAGMGGDITASGTILRIIVSVVYDLI